MVFPALYRLAAVAGGSFSTQLRANRGMVERVFGFFGMSRAARNLFPPIAMSDEDMLTDDGVTLVKLFWLNDGLGRSSSSVFDRERTR